MKIEFTGRHLDVPPAIRRLAERKLQKLGRVLPGITRAHVILAGGKHRLMAEVSVHSPHLDLSAEDESGDLAACVAAAVDKLTRQAQRHMGKRRDHLRPQPPARTRLDKASEASAPETRAPRIIRARRVAAKPMTLDEAALEVMARPEGFLVFRHAGTERLCVLYRRPDGNLGLLDPEP